MKVTCTAHLGKALPEKCFALGYTVQTVFHIAIGKEYVVFALSIWKSTLSVLVSDENDLPNWYPIELFSITDDHLPEAWFFASYPEIDDGLQFLWGYERLIRDPTHYDALLEREPGALEIFYAEKRRHGWSIVSGDKRAE